MTGTVRRAGAFAAVGTLAVATPAFQRAAADVAVPTAGGLATAVPFAAVAAFAATVDGDDRLFELFARPGDREEGRLYGLLGFSLGATALALLASFTGLPVSVFVGTVLLVAYGNFAATVATQRASDPIVPTGAFAAGGTVAFVAGQAAARAILGAASPVAELVFLGVSGALLGALLRTALFADDDPLVLLPVGLLSWFLSDLVVGVAALEVAVAVVVTVAFGYLSYALDTASVTGSVTGVLLGVLTIVLGGYGWFAVLIAFFGIGGLASKFRYDRKRERGVAEPNEGARGSGNVLANAAVALGAVLAYAATTGGLIGVPPGTFVFAFTGSLAVATADTLASEIGGLFDRPRLITTFETVPPGTDGAVTWQGELAGVGGAAMVAGIAVGLLSLSPTGGGLVVLAGLAGMTVDSLLGATVEGPYLGNQGVNFLATLSGAIVAAAVALAVGLA